MLATCTAHGLVDVFAMKGQFTDSGPFTSANGDVIQNPGQGCWLFCTLHNDIAVTCSGHMVRNERMYNHARWNAGDCEGVFVLH